LRSSAVSHQPVISETAKLKARLAELEAENATLKARIEELISPPQGT
jgi:cell division protein FtsB